MLRPRLLYLSSVPRGQAALDILREVEEIKRRIGDAVALETHHCVTPRHLRAVVEASRPDIVQITAHGSKRGRLLLEPDHRDRHEIDAGALTELFGALPGIRLVVLRACHSYALAQEIAQRVGLAVGMHDKVEDSATIACVAALYQALAEGLGAVEAFGRAMRAYEAHAAEPTAGPQLAIAGPGADHRFVAAGAPRSPARVHPCLVPPLDRPARRPYIAPQGLLPALHEAQSRRSACVLNLVGGAGLGKSAGLARWLAQLRRRRFPGLERVFAWSFDQDDTPSARCSAATRCAGAALKYFADEREGDPAPWGPHQPELTGWALGQRLAQVLQRRRSLLVLDGVASPLYHPAPRASGAALDPVLDGLLHELALLARPFPSLVVIGSRAPLWSEPGPPGFARLDLEGLSLAQSQSLLRRLGVAGCDEAVRAVATRCARHPMALSLAAHELVYHARGDARAAPAAGGAPGLPWALRRYGEGLAAPEREALHRAALASGPRDEALAGYVRDYLITSGVARVDDERLEIHPALRGYLERASPWAREAWDVRYHRAAAHAVVAGPAAPRRRESLPPVLDALVYAVRAGRWEEALELYFGKFVDDVRRPLITRELGAIVPVLAAIQQFFQVGWEPAWSGLSPARQAVLLHHAGLALRHLGCTQAAVEPLRRALAIFAGEPADASALGVEPLERAATCANDLAEVFLGLGRLDRALDETRRGEELARRLPPVAGELPHAHILNVATRGEVHRLRGELEAARAAFAELDALFAGAAAQSRPGYYQRRFQLDELGRLAGAERDAAATALEASLLAAGAWSESPRVARITRALVWLVEVAWRLRSAGAGEPDAVAEAREQAQRALAQAARRVRETEHVWLLPEVHLAAARLRRVTGDWVGAALELRRAEELAARCELELAAIDAALERARLAQAMHREDGDEAHLHRVSAGVERARQRIAATGYALREPECAALQRWLVEHPPVWPEVA